MSAIGVFLAELYPRLSRNRAKLSAVALYALITCAIGTSTAVAVASSPTCSQLVRTYVERLERNHVSVDTLKRWHDWGIGHPNWKPSLHARRPKYKKIREEVATNEPIACPVFNPPPSGDISLLDEHLDLYLLPVEPPDLTPSIYAPATPTQASLVPPVIFPGAPIGPILNGGGTPVVVPPVTTPPNTPTPPVVPEPVPEPNSIILSLTGMAALIAMIFWQRKNLLVRPS